MKHVAHMLLLVVLSASISRAADDGLQLTMPPEFFAVPGVPMSIYFDNVVLTQTPEAYRFEVECGIGQTDERRWSVTATAAQVGDHLLKISVSSSDGKPIASQKATLRVIPASAGSGREMRLLIVGDSLTHATVYPNEIARLLSQPENPRWTMLGTHKPAAAAAGVAHEGYGGWTWQRFASHAEPNPDGTYRKRSSPFVFQHGDKPVLDVARYLNEESAGQSPDFVIFMLGINDCFGASPDSPDERIDAMFKQADVLLTAFRAAAPAAELGICLTPPPNSRQAAFEANYGDRYSRWGWKRIQHRLVQRQLERFADHPATGTFLIPMELNLDPLDGYPENNGVHPSAAGYQQMGASIFAWLKSRLAASSL